MTQHTSTLHLLVGPVGAGKTTFGRTRTLGEPALFLDLDTWMVRLFGDDQRPQQDVIAWYVERRERCRALLWDLTLEVLGAGRDVWLELGLIDEPERSAFYERARQEDVRFVVYQLDAPREVRRQRVAERNRAATAHTQIVPPEFFEGASDLWRPITDEERRTIDVVDVSVLGRAAEA